MLEHAALALLIVIVIFIIYLFIYIHDIPYKIAKERGHPHQDAIHIAGWVSMFLAHSIWPFLWIWAYLYKPGSKFMQLELTVAGSSGQDARIAQLETQILSLTESLQAQQTVSSHSQAEGSNNG